MQLLLHSEFNVIIGHEFIYFTCIFQLGKTTLEGRTDMHIESFEFFMKVVDAKSISKVSSQSHISQSALSQLIQKMEDYLGYELLKRSNKGVEMTEMGKVVYEHASVMSRTFDKMKLNLENLENKQTCVLINGPWSLVNYSLPCIIFQLKKKFPSYMYELASSPTAETIIDIENGICDFGITYGKPSKKGYLVESLGHEKIVLVASNVYKIPDSITIEDLLKYDLIMLKDQMQIFDRLSEKLSEKKLSSRDLNILFNIDSIGAVKASVHNGFGVSFLPYMSVKKEIYEKKFRLIEIDDFSLNNEIYLVSKKLDKVSKSARDSIKHFMELGPKAFC